MAPVQVALAHEGESHPAKSIWSTWGLEPLPVALLLLSAFLYAYGTRRLWRASAPGHGLRKWEAYSYWAGWVSLAVALVSPIHPLGSVLFSVHMTQHELLMLVAAPLLVLGHPVIPFLWALPKNWARKAGGLTHVPAWRSFWRGLTLPLVAFTIHAVALWVWHIPPLFEATLDSEWIHNAQHLSFFGSALLFWWSILQVRRGALAYGLGVLYLFTTALHSGLLGALLTFAGRTLYPAYEGRTEAWGLSALEDQQLGGLIMWIPAGLVYIFAGLILFAGWLRESDRRLALRNTLPLLLIGILLAGCNSGSAAPGSVQAIGNPVAGRSAIGRYGCTSCHAIPGIRSDAFVGPSLQAIGRRTYIGGVIVNTPANMIRWIKNPPGIDSLTAMPNLGVTDQDARDIAAYLYTLR